jgi:FlaA1/EpsC-like NDP-sugar epimerase
VLCEELSVRTVLLAMPSANLRRRRTVLKQLSEFPVRVQTVPAYRDIVSGKARVDELSDVAVNDLLGRDPVPPDPTLLKSCITGKSVMVTGAGGSIGGELCRQILQLDPERLVLLDTSETALYRISKELEEQVKDRLLDLELLPILGSVTHEEKLCKTLEVFGVETVYHAAAYKHVPLVEHNIFEGIGNNVFGTLHAARAAIDAGVATFVLISTDKAVNPTSIMGATKRLAEMVLQAFARDATATKFCMVRFGNVLESSGSVVPLFRKQIRKGGPVTVTHRDIIRYFMTIPEAAELVIQAGSMAKGGDVFVLDMGEPVRVQDLAYRMINLMGLSVLDEKNPDGDIEIQYIGLRPAEKLYEELLIGSNASGTHHPRICRADEDYLAADVIAAIMADLAEATDALDFEGARAILARAVTEYEPTNDIDDLIWRGSNRVGREQDPADKVVDFRGRDQSA